MLQFTPQYLMFRQWGVYLAYGVTVASIGGAAFVGARTLTNAYVDMAVRSAADNPRPLSRVERHLKVAARSVAFKPSENDNDVVALVLPDINPAQLAAAIDSAERPEIAGLEDFASRTVVLGWTKDESHKGREKLRTPKAKHAAVARLSRKAGKSQAPSVTDTSMSAAANELNVAPWPGKMALLPKAALAKTTPNAQPSVKLSLQDTMSLPVRRRGATPGEIIRISLLGAH